LIERGCGEINGNAKRLHTYSQQLQILRAQARERTINSRPTPIKAQL